MRIDEFLLARIAEDEVVARAARTEPWDEIAFHDQGADDIPHIARWAPARVLAECEAKRSIIEACGVVPEFAEWTPDCGGDWCLSGGVDEDEPGVSWFANYWPDKTVSASVYVNGDRVLDSGIVAKRSKAECQVFAENWLRRSIPTASPIIRALARVYADHAAFNTEW